MLVVFPVPFTPTTSTIAGLGPCAVGATFRSPANASPSPHSCPFAAPFTSSVASSSAFSASCASSGSRIPSDFTRSRRPSSTFTVVCTPVSAAISVSSSSSHSSSSSPRRNIPPIRENHVRRVRSTAWSTVAGASAAASAGSTAPEGGAGGGASGARSSACTRRQRTAVSVNPFPPSVELVLDVPQPQTQHPRGRVRPHRHAVDAVRHLDRPAVVRYHDELRLLRELLQRRDEPPHVRLVQHRVHLVQHAERRGVRLQQREQQRDSGQRLLPPGELRHALQPLARRLRLYLHTRVVQVLRVRQRKPRVSAAEERLEILLEPRRHRLERRLEPLAHHALQLLDGAVERLLGPAQVLQLRRKEVVPLPQLRVVLLRLHVHRPQPSHIPPQPLDVAAQRRRVDLRATR